MVSLLFCIFPFRKLIFAIIICYSFLIEKILIFRGFLSINLLEKVQFFTAIVKHLNSIDKGLLLRIFRYHGILIEEERHLLISRLILNLAEVLDFLPQMLESFGIRLLIFFQVGSFKLVLFLEFLHSIYNFNKLVLKAFI